MSNSNSPRWRPGQPRPSAEGAEMEAVRRRFQSGGAYFDRGTVGLGVTGNPQGYDIFNNNFARLGEQANRPRTKSAAQDLIRQSFNVQDGTDKTTIDSLPDIGQVVLHKKGAEGQIYVDGTLTSIPGGNEEKRMDEIYKRLEKTLTILDLDPEEKDIKALEQEAKRYPNKSSYAVPYGDTYMLARETIGLDIRWLTSRINNINTNGLPDDNIVVLRQKLFTQYRSELIKLKNTLTTPAMEHQYLVQNGSDTDNRRMLEEFCRDPNAVKGASKFALFLAVGTLLALWGAKDLQRGDLSFGTIILAAGAMFLSKSGPATAYMTSSQFADLSKHLGPEMYEDIKNLQPSAKNHLIKMLKSPTGRAGFPGKDDILLLTEPKSPSKRIPEEIARKFIGYRGNAGAAYVLERSAKVKDPQGREIELSLVDANAKSNTAQRELNDLID